MATASELERGKYFMYKGEVCKVNRKEIVTYGTHCHSKLKFYIEDIDGKSEKTVTFQHQDRVDMVEVMKKTASIISISDSNVQIMDAHSYETFDAQIDPALKAQLKEGDEVIFVNLNSLVKVLEKK
jgi:translation elongation factor P/translation initiation factor 5A